MIFCAISGDIFCKSSNRVQQEIVENRYASKIKIIVNRLWRSPEFLLKKWHREIMRVRGKDHLFHSFRLISSRSIKNGLYRFPLWWNTAVRQEQIIRAWFDWPFIL